LFLTYGDYITRGKMTAALKDMKYLPGQPRENKTTGRDTWAGCFAQLREQ